MNNERFNIGNIRKKREKLKAFSELLCSFGVSLYLKGEDRSRTLFEIFVVKLLLLARCKRGVVYAFNLRMILEEVNNLESVFNMTLNSERKGFKSLKKQERVERRNRCSLIPHQCRAKLENISKIAASLGENNAVV